MKKVLCILLLIGAFQVPAEAQVFDKIKKKVTKKKNQTEEDAIDKGIESVEGIFKKKKKKKGNTAEGTEKDEAPTQDGPVIQPGMSDKKAQEIWMTRYDFKPGREIIFFDDFENEQIGEIPSKWYYRKGLMEVVQVSGQNNHVVTGDLGGGRPNWEEGFVLPEAYTIEFDVYMPNTKGKDRGFGGYDYSLTFYDEGYRGSQGRISIAHGSMGIKDKAYGKVPGITESDLANTWNHISISVNGNSVKAYFNDYRVFNTRLADGAQPILFTLWNCCQTAEKLVFFMDNFKVSAGAHPKYKEEILEGKIVSNNIHFETNSSEIIPRSYAEIKRIADVMEDQPNAVFRIDGHTDNQGEDVYNLELSKERANAVRKALTEMGISGSRLTTEGFGESLPIENNDTPEGRAMNRRVEFIVL